jgi:hypothetical protein
MSPRRVCQDAVWQALQIAAVEDKRVVAYIAGACPVLPRQQKRAC